MNGKPAREPNHRLRQARERIPSREAPGESMSLREVAEAVNAHLFEATGKVYDFDAHHLAKLERGVIRWPTAPYRSGLRAVLGAATDTDLGFRPPRRSTRAATAPGAMASVERIEVRSPPPARVGRTDVEHVRATTASLAGVENLHGGGLSAEAAAGQLRWATRLLRVPAASDVRRELYESVGNLASVVGYSAFDIADHAAADRCFRFAVWCAEQAGSWELRASGLTDLARQSGYLGDPDRALSLVELAQVRSDQLSATTRAMLAAIRARLLATAGRHDDARAEVERADEHFAGSSPGDCPPWMCYYDLAEHRGSTARALTPAAIATDSYDEVAQRLTDAIRLHGPAYPRSRAFSRIRLATLQLGLGRTDDAVHTGRDALAEAAPLRSDRLRREFDGFARAARVHRSEDVAELGHDVGRFLAAG